MNILLVSSKPLYFIIIHFFHKRYVSATTGLASIILFLPCVFKEFSTLDVGKSNGNAKDDTTETLKMDEAETLDGKDIIRYALDSSKIPVNKKGLKFDYLHACRLISIISLLLVK